MTEHPEELLAAYVDGELDAADRRAVQAHLRSCERCRGEVEMARVARDALTSLPEVPAPEGTAFRVLREARRPPATGRVWRIATAVGVAASLAAGVLVLSQRVDLGGGGRGDMAADSGADAGGAARPAQGRSDEQQGAAEAGPEATAALGADRLGPVFRVTNARYTLDDMPEVIARLSERANAMLRANVAFATVEDDAGGLGRRAAAALECSESAIRAATAVEDPGVPFVFETAAFFDEFAGEYVPGYVATYLRGESPNERPTQLVMTVIDRTTCERLLYLARPVEL